MLRRTRLRAAKLALEEECIMWHNEFTKNALSIWVIVKYWREPAKLQNKEGFHKEDHYLVGRKV